MLEKSLQGVQELEGKREMSEVTSGIEVICGGREATKEELKAWQQVEEKIKLKDKEQERSDWQQAVLRTFLEGH